MRIYFESLTLPKKAAKRIQAHFTPKYDDMPFKKMALSRAQQITAWMLGYESWHELEQVTKAKKHPPSPMDEDCAPEEQIKRLDYQTAVFGQISPLIGIVCREIVIKLRVSAKNPLSENLAEQNFNKNRIRHWVDPFSGRGEWRFLPSRRSIENGDDLYELSELWACENLDFDEYSACLVAMLEARPEDMNVIAEILRLMVNDDEYVFPLSKLDEFESAIRAVIPADFPETGQVFFNWLTMENRTFHRATLWLAGSYDLAKEYDKARYWFEFTSRSCKTMRAECISILRELRKKTSGRTPRSEMIPDT